MSETCQVSLFFTKVNLTANGRRRGVEGLAGVDDADLGEADADRLLPLRVGTLVVRVDDGRWLYELCHCVGVVRREVLLHDVGVVLGHRAQQAVHDVGLALVRLRAEGDLHQPGHRRLVGRQVEPMDRSRTSARRRSRRAQASESQG